MKTLKYTVAAFAVAAMMISPVSANRIASADVEGAIGGAGAGFGMGGPWGAVIGAVVGGAAMSLAAAAKATGPSLGDPRAISVWDPTGGNCGDIVIPRPFGCGGGRPASGPVFSAQTPATEAGYWHNRIVKAYMAENGTFDTAALERIAIRELGLAKTIANDPRIKEVVTTSARYSVGGKKSPWGTYLTEQGRAIVDGSASASDKGKAMSELERKMLEQHGRDEASRIGIQAAMSVYRHSEAFWNNAQSIAEGNCMIEPTRCGTLPSL